MTNYLDNRIYDLLEKQLEPGSGLSTLSAQERYELYDNCLENLLAYLFDQEGDCTVVDDRARFSFGGRASNSSDSPVDKNNEPMLFVGEVSLPVLGKEGKLIQIFLSRNIDSFREKDSSWFHIGCSSRQESSMGLDRSSFSVAPDFNHSFFFASQVIDQLKFKELVDSKDLAANTSLMYELLELFDKFNLFLYKDNARDLLLQFKMARQKAAFFANGISYSDARARDAHYDHLVTEANRWFVLFKLRENSVLKLTGNRDILFTIRYDDFKSGAIHKGRPIII